jgi:hypothetical protein
LQGTYTLTLDQIFVAAGKPSPPPGATVHFGNSPGSVGGTIFKDTKTAWNYTAGCGREEQFQPTFIFSTVDEKTQRTVKCKLTRKLTILSGADTTCRCKCCQAFAPGGPHQPTHSLDLLLYAIGPQEKKTYDKLLKKVAKESKPHAIPLYAPVKQKPRSVEKIEGDYNGDVSRLLDVVRGSLQWNHPDNIYDNIPLINSTYRVIRMRDRIQDPLPTGYRSINLNLLVDSNSCFISEMQLVVKALQDVYGPSHQYYEELRSITAKAEIENREMTAAEKARAAELEAIIKRMYDEAWAKVIGGGAKGGAVSSPPPPLTPRYVLVGGNDMPVKAVSTPTGGVLAYAWNDEAGDMVVNQSMLKAVLLQEGDVQSVSEVEFESVVARLKVRTL